METVRRYSGEEYLEVELCGVRRRLQIRKVGEGVWIASDAALAFGCDTEFTEAVGRELAWRLARFSPECILTAEAKSVALAYEVSKDLGLKEYALARKHVKAYMEEALIEEVRSITTKEPQLLVLDELNSSRVRGKRVALLDDVISTGGTMLGLLNLAKKAGAEVCCISAIWLEGPWPWTVFRDWIGGGRLIYLGTLPVYSESGALGSTSA